MTGMTFTIYIILMLWVPSVGQAFAQSATMVLIPAREFQMGSNAAEDEPPHTVHLSAFYIDKFEITQEQFQKVMENNPSDFNGKNLPVEQVTWYEARDYCKAVDQRLPTEAEWEKAARGGTHTVYYWGDAIDGDFAWYWDNSKRSTHPVGTRKPNAFGLHDMSGNVWEWVADYYEDTYYKSSPRENPAGPFTSKYRVIRGGSWRDLPEFLRTTRRNYDLPAGRFNHIGFRCAQSAE
jgi:sulfatase modifying factor 1